MAASNTTALQARFNLMQENYALWQKWKQQFVDDHNLVLEYLRQLKVHQASGAVNDAENVSKLLEVAYGAQGTSNANQQKYEQLYNESKKDYDTAYSSLTPKEQEQLSNQVDAEINKTNAESEQTRAQAQIAAQAATFAQSKSQIIFYVGIGLLLIGGGLFLYFKFLKKPAI